MFTKADVPKSVPIGPHVWKFEFVDDLWIHDDKWGACRIRTLTIQIDRNVPDGSQLAACVIHELLHAAAWTFGMPDELNNDEVMHYLDKAVLALLTSSPKLFADIIAKCGG